MISTTNAIMAKEALTRPESFMYSGSKDMFKTWGITGFYKTPSSDVLERSNFEVIYQDLINRFPGDIDIETYSHWAFGSIDQLICKVLKKETSIDDDNITDVFDAVIEWHEKLESYCVADEEHYSNLESEEDYE